MKICNIYSVSNQGLYDVEEYVMILAHLLKQGLYDPRPFNLGQYIIMDNGLFEGEQVSTDLESLIQLASNSGIPVKEIVVPDIMNNYSENIKLFVQNIETIKKYKNEYKFMVVAHSSNIDEFISFFNYINDESFNELKDCLVIGVPKCCSFNRTNEICQALYKKCKYPIHFLGMKNNETFCQLKNVENVRTCDTSLLSIITKYHGELNAHDIGTYLRSENETIDLLNDFIDMEQLIGNMVRQKEIV